MCGKQLSSDMSNFAIQRGANAELPTRQFPAPSGHHVDRPYKGATEGRDGPP